MDNPDNADWRRGHRSRLRERFLADKLVEYEILELILGDIILRRDVRPLARRLMAKYGSIHQVLAAPVKELMEFPGVSQAVAVHLKVVQRVSQMELHWKISDAPIFIEQRSLEDYCKKIMAGKMVEEFHVLYLDRRRQLIEDETHSIGSLNESAVYERKIIQRILNLNAYSIVLLHNHLTPDLKFSSQDVDTTQNLMVMLRPLGIEVYDHYVINNGDIYSMKGEGCLQQIRNIANRL